MIVQQAARLRNHIAEYTSLQKSANEVERIKATSDDLAMLLSELNAWMKTYHAIQSCLTSQDQTDLRKRAVRIRAKVIDSHRDFTAAEYAQHDALKSVLDSLRSLKQTTEGAWKTYASAMLDPLREQVRFARQLPSMQSQLADIDQHVVILQNHSVKLPRDAGEVESFHSHVVSLERALRNLEGLAPEHKAFLDKVQAGTATLADVSGPLLDWCKTEGLASLLKLRLS